MYLIFIGLVALLTLILPLTGPWVTKKFGVRVHPAPRWLPLLAATAYITGIFLPDIHISPETTTFQQHLVSGGFYTAILYAYFTRLLGWRPHWLVALIGLFAFTSTLGVANEVLEFTLTKLNLTHIDITDTSWDIVANTIGSLACYSLFKISEFFSRRFVR